MNLILKDLNSVLLLLIQKAEVNGVTTFELDQDYYWKLSDISKPSEMNIGSLKDDWMELQDLFEESRAASLVDVQRLGNILVALGYEMTIRPSIAPDPFKAIYIELNKLHRLLDYLLKDQFAFGENTKVLFKNDNYWIIAPNDLFNVALAHPSTIVSPIQQYIGMLCAIISHERDINYEDMAYMGHILIILGEGVDYIQDLDIQVGAL